MKSRRLSDKSQAIVEALAEGRSCDQILASDPTLTYHDIFRAAAEAPENQRNRQRSRAGREGWQTQVQSGWRRVKHEALTKTRD